MRSKSFAACMALAILGVLAVLPAMAWAANNPLVVENGTAVATGTKIAANNTEVTKMTTSLGTIECPTATMTGELVKNTTGSVEGNITSAVFSGTGAQQAGAPAPECTTAEILVGDTTVTPNTPTNGLPWCLRATAVMSEHEFQVRGNSCDRASRPIRFALDVTGIGTCTYERTTAIPGKYTTSTTDSVLSISEVEFPRISGPFGCPNAGWLDMKFTMKTDVAGGASLGITS
jgi:hypothetical protein